MLETEPPDPPVAGLGVDADLDEDAWLAITNEGRRALEALVEAAKNN